MTAAINRLRERSRVAFGQAYRLEVMLAIADTEGGIVSLGEIAKSLDLSPSQIQKPFADLKQLGLIAELPAADSRRKFCIRQPSPAWDWAREMARTVEAYVDEPN